MKIAFFGSSLVSAYWNGAATYYRGIIRSLAERGHEVTFYEPDAWQRQQHRDIEDPIWAKVVVYPANEDSVMIALESARHSDLIVKASGVGLFDELLESSVLHLKTSSNLVVFWDVDAPATLDRLGSNTNDPFHLLIPRYDAIFTYGGGSPVVEAYKQMRAKECTPIYNALDPQTHFPVDVDPRFDGDLAFLGNRLPDREARVEEFLLKPAEKLSHHQFLLGGSGWSDKAKPANVRYFDHVYTANHNAFNSTPRIILNVTRESMARFGFSPATRVFEAAGAAGCMVTDVWEGIEQFFEPDREILVAHDGNDVIDFVETVTPNRARAIGQQAYRRVLAQHTYAHRAAQVDAVLGVSGRELVGTRQ